MKTFTKRTFLILLMTVAVSSATFASTTPAEKIGVVKELSPTERQTLINRLEEIKSMDTQHMTRKERKELRHEKAAVENEIDGRRGGGGIYISVGAIIIILLLIIILH